MRVFMLLLLSSSLYAQQPALPNAPQPNGFFANHINTGLSIGEGITRLLDAISSREAVTCHCEDGKNLLEGGHLFGASLAPITAHNWSIYSYSIGFATANILVSRELWNVSERHRHHGKVLRFVSRGMLITDIVVDGTYGPVNNWELIHSHGKQGVPGL